MITENVRKDPLSRDEMMKAIDQGGSILFKGRIITQKHLLPSEAELALGDPAREAEATVLLQDQITKLSDQLSALKDGTFGQRFAQKAADAVGPIAEPPASHPMGAVTTPDDLKEAQRRALMNPNVPAPEQMAPQAAPAAPPLVMPPPPPPAAPSAPPPPDKGERKPR